MRSETAVILFGLALAINAEAKLTPEQAAALPSPVNRPVDFAKDVQPILETSCARCHARGHEKGGFRIDTRELFLQGGDSGPAIVPGRSEASYLIELVAGADPDNVMPQKGSRLSAEQVGLLRAWIDQNLPWADNVSFAKAPPRNLFPRQPPVPEPTANFASTNPIDLFLRDYFRTNGISWSEPVSDAVFARRVFLDLVGLLPPAAELGEFLKDSAGDKRERLVQRLLADRRRYAEHWLSFWNDALRNDYAGTGYIDDGRKQISGWLYASLAENVPYDQFVRELIDPTPASEGFTKGIVWRGAVNSSQTPQMQAAQNISQVFMGVNLKCASCHDSFVNDWTLAEAYGMASVYATNSLEMFECDKPTGQTASARFLYSELGEIPAEATLEERRKRLAEIMTCAENGRLARTIVNRLWARFMGSGLVEPLDDMEQPAWHQDLLDWLATDLAGHRYDLKRTIFLIVTSRAYQLPAVRLNERAAHDFVFRGPGVRRLSAEQFCDALRQLADVWHPLPAPEINFAAGVRSGKGAGEELMPAPARWVWRDTNAAVKTAPGAVYLRRTFVLPEKPEEARLLVACDNEYTLYVNGVAVASGKDYKKPGLWDVRAQLKAGTNLFAVAAVNNRNGNKPPEEDKAPAESDFNPAGLFIYARLRHAGNAWDLGTDTNWICSAEKAGDWEKPRFEASGWASAVDLGLPGMKPWELEAKLLSALSVILVEGQVRSALVKADPLMTALGRPPREQVMTSRPGAATTLQALELTNGETLTRLLGRCADRLLSGDGGDGSAIVTRIYRQGLSRLPTTEERKAAEAFLGEPASPAGVQDLLWAVAMLPEFQLIY